MRNLLSILLISLLSEVACFQHLGIIPTKAPKRGLSVPTGTTLQANTHTERSNLAKLEHSIFALHVTPTGTPEDDNVDISKPDFVKFGFFCTVSVFYWYLMVLGAAAKVNGLPVPDFIPMVPGWPATEADFQDVLEDSYHFFYLSELLHNNDAPYVSPPRLAVFNVVEAWIFALLPALWKDPKRLPRPALLGSWAILGINLTNAFLAPYLAITELSKKDDDENVVFPKNRIFSSSFAAVASLVVVYAIFQSVFVASGTEWKEFLELAASNRTYLAFCVDPIVLAIFQPLVLARFKGGKTEPLDYVPFFGLVSWLLSADDRQTD